MAAEKTYRVQITRGVRIGGEAFYPDGKGGPIVTLKGYDARAIVSANRGVFVDGEKPTGPLSAESEGSALIRKSASKGR